MEVESMRSSENSTKELVDEEEMMPLPGFRFHPTDEELVGFYLRRKVEKRPISIELIKQIDIYKYDPWDLPKSGNVGEKEWYFFCKRGRKYRNSIRPNRVTGSGFWKATGIDKPIYSSSSSGRECIGLKKSLVYYRGSAGKGTKTDWMMHEFRLPAEHDYKSTQHVQPKNISQEAEVWTLCRILKRNGSSHRKSVQQDEWRLPMRNNPSVIDHTTSKTHDHDSPKQTDYIISFGAAPIIMRHNNETKPFNNNGGLPHHHHHVDMSNTYNNQFLMGQLSSSSSTDGSSYSNFGHNYMNDMLKHTEWDELTSVFELVVDPLF